MEKFCIVKRRKAAPLGEQVREAIVVNDGSSALQREASFPFDEEPAEAAATVANRPISGMEAENRSKEQSVRIVLTPEQCQVMSRGDGVESLFGRILGDASAEINYDKEGRIILNLHLKYAYGTRMLTGLAVTEMLQVSRGMLTKLVREGRIKSYKIGRLRRFMLEDVLEYVSRAGELKKLLTAEPQ